MTKNDDEKFMDIKKLPQKSENSSPQVLYVS